MLKPAGAYKLPVQTQPTALQATHKGSGLTRIHLEIEGKKKTLGDGGLPSDIDNVARFGSITCGHLVKWNALICTWILR
jgi:hypothetical protein